MFNRSEYALLNRMLDDAISGDFLESRFDESELSKLQSKLMRYLTSSALSERKLREERRNLEELITNISHQTKTPLTNIMMYAQLLEETVTDGPAKAYADEIRLQSKKLDELIRALVKMSRLETGVFRLQPEEASLLAVLSRAAAQTAPAAKAKGVRLALSEERDARVMLDVKWITEAVCNVLDNAVKYSGKGTEVRLAVFSYELFSGIRVEDRGVGIPEEEIPMIFQRFYRGRSVRDREGIGVGLFLARQLVENHGGYIKVTSAAGEGSTFDLCFPNMSAL